MSKSSKYFSFDSATDTPTHSYIAKRIYWQLLSDSEWQVREDAGAKETSKSKFESQDKPKAKRVFRKNEK